MSACAPCSSQRNAAEAAIADVLDDLELVLKAYG